MIIVRKIDCNTDGVYDIPCNSFKEILSKVDVNLDVKPDSEVILRCFQEKYKALITNEKTKQLTSRQYELVTNLMNSYFNSYG